MWNRNRNQSHQLCLLRRLANNEACASRGASTSSVRSFQMKKKERKYALTATARMLDDAFLALSGLYSVGVYRIDCLTACRVIQPAEFIIRILHAPDQPHASNKICPRYVHIKCLYICNNSEINNVQIWMSWSTAFPTFNNKSLLYNFWAM